MLCFVSSCDCLTRFGFQTTTCTILSTNQTHKSETRQATNGNNQMLDNMQGALQVVCHSVAAGKWKNTCVSRNNFHQQPIIDHSQCNVLRNCKSNDSSVLDCPKTDSCDTITNEEESSSVESDKMQCCGICMEPFQVNEEVSWSSTSECHHAFHPPCINAWLVGHIGCPLCRRMFMLVDDTPKRVSNEELVALSRIQKKRKKSTFFCIRDGLIVITDTVDLEKQQQNTNKVVTETRNVLCDGLTEVTRANHNEDSPDTQTSSMYPYDGSPNLQQRKASLPFRRVSSSDQCEKTTTLTSDNTTIFAKASTETALTTVSSTLSDL